MYVLLLANVVELLPSQHKHIPTVTRLLWCGNGIWALVVEGD